MKLCECGCGQEVLKPWRRFLHNHYWRGQKHSEETKRKMSLAQIGISKSEEAKKNMSKAAKGKIVSEETKRKMSEWHSNQTLTEEHKRNLSKAKKVQIVTIEHRRKISETLTGKMCGEKNGNWRGGSPIIYCGKFNWKFKERVRDFFNRKCFECGISEIDHKRKLSVHHVNYDKMVCCNDTIPLFVPLCASCHGKSSVNRDYWEEKYTRELMERTNGNSFIPTHLMDLIDFENNWIELLNEYN